MYYTPDTIVYYNGQFQKAGELRGDLYSQSLHYGYGVFEGIRAYATPGGAMIFKAQEHFRRMEASCHAVGIPYPFDNKELERLTYDLLDRNGLQDAYIRPLVTCTPNMSLTRGKESVLLIAAWKWEAYLGHRLLRVLTSSIRRPSPAAFRVEAKVTGHYVNSIMACQEAKDKGYDEALLLDEQGFVAEGPGANLFVERNGVLYTPAPGNILRGITRSTLIGLAGDMGLEVVEAKLRPDEVRGADSAFFCGTAAEVAGLQSLDDVPFTRPWGETLGCRLGEAYCALVRESTFQKKLHVA